METYTFLAISFLAVTSISFAQTAAPIEESPTAAQPLGYKTVAEA
jgi:hypothetical protein